jgi:hypothetical protein
LPTIVTTEEQRAVIGTGLGKYELEIINGFNVPLFWTVPLADGKLRYRNGTAFFLRAGDRPIGVTASHVIRGWEQSRVEEGAGSLYLAGHRDSLEIDWAARVIDDDFEIDIATFSISEQEVKALGKMIMTGAQKVWPPRPPPRNCLLYYCGFPGVGTRPHPQGGPLFGAVPGMGIATSVSEKSISIQLEREYLVPLLGGGVPPENFDFGGISGGPVIKIVDLKGLRTYACAGVLYQGPNTALDPEESIPGFELISARHAHFLQADGRLDRARWQACNP